LLNETVVAISEAELLKVAGPRSFERGTGYVEAVRGLKVAGAKVTASVRGTDDYIVVLTLPENGGVTGVCDCPHGREGFFCKHCVAVGLAFLRHAPDEDEPDNLVTWLASLSHDELFDLVIDRVVEDADWRQQLDLRAAAAWADDDALLEQMTSLLNIAGFGEYGYVEEGESRRYASRVVKAQRVIDELTAADNANLAAALAEYAIEVIADHYAYAVDPAGVIGDAVVDLMDSHLAACLDSNLEPDGLAKFIARRMLSGGDMPRPNLVAYRAALGVKGAAKLRELLTAGAATSLAGRAALEEFLRFAGDVDALVASMAADLPPSGDGHLKIAEELQRAGRPDEALAWAERGLREAASVPPLLADYVADRYTAKGRLADALTVRRDEFAVLRSEHVYDQLRTAAEQAGAWGETRPWALDLLRADARALRPQHGLKFAAEPVLIDVLASEGDVDAAWAEAPGVASERQWRRLADLAAPIRPADALAVYLRQLKLLRQETGDRAYERIADLLVSARDCHRRLGKETEFDSYLRYLRLEQKRKRKLIAILDARGLRPSQGLAPSTV